MKVLNPYNQSVLSELRLSSFEEANSLFSIAAQSQKTVIPLHQRLEILKRLRKILNEKREKMISTLVQESGKPLKDAQVEFYRALNSIEIAEAELYHLAGEEIPMGQTRASSHHWAMTKRRPVGLVLAISAFNHPLNLAVHQVVPAVAVDCPVVFKPDLRTPLSGKILIEALWEAGWPKEKAHYLVCENGVAEPLVQDSRLRFLNFVGSAKVGWALRSRLAIGADCLLEHGGAAPVILDETASWEEALESLVKAAFYHAGQVCVSAQKFFVHENLFRDFQRAFVERVKSLNVGDPSDPETEVGPLIDEAALTRVLSWVKEAKEEGAKILCGGKALNESCLQPTVLLEPDPQSRVSQDEVFGPVACLYSFKNFEEVLNVVNQSEFAFQSSVFTQRLDRAGQAIEVLEAQTVLINEHPAFRVDHMPFGGFKKSGFGVGGIGSTMRKLTREQLVIAKT